jgi:hypothetical protein
MDYWGAVADQLARRSRGYRTGNAGVSRAVAIADTSASSSLHAIAANAAESVQSGEDAGPIKDPADAKKKTVEGGGAPADHVQGGSSGQPGGSGWY